MTSASLALWGLLAPSVSSVSSMSSVASASGLALTSPSPEPAELVQTPPPELVTPGTIGFLVTFGVAVALVLLVRDMVRRNRGLVVRAERRDAELRAQAEADAAAEDRTRRPRDGRDGRGPAAPNG